MRLSWIFVFLAISCSTLMVTEASAAVDLKSIEGEVILTGQKFQASVDGKKGLVVIFLSAKCPCSDSHVAELRDLGLTYKDFSFVAVHSNSDEPLALARTYFESAALPYPVLRDSQAKLADLLRAMKTPHAFVFLPNGAVAYQGGVSNSKNFSKSDRKFLREALVDVQAGRAVKTPEGRTLGCVIARGEKSAL